MAWYLSIPPQIESTFYNHPASPHRDIFRVSNDPAEGCTGVGRTGWHIDGSFQERPFSHSIYHMVKVSQRQRVQTADPPQPARLPYILLKQPAGSSCQRHSVRAAGRAGGGVDGGEAAALGEAVDDVGPQDWTTTSSSIQVIQLTLRRNCPS